MGWARLDENRADNPKLLAAGFEARGLDEAAICWSARAGTDGHISPDAVAMLAVGHGCRSWRKVVARLVDVGRWEVNGNGWVIHDYLDYNPSKAETDAQRERVSKVRADAGRQGGIMSGRSRREASGKQNASEPREANHNQDACEATNPVPSRPVPKLVTPVSTDSTRGVDNQGTGTGISTTTGTNLVGRLAGMCTGTNRHRVEAEALDVTNWALAHVDPVVVDEAIGACANAPSLPRAVASIIRMKAGDHGIRMPAFDPGTP